MLISLNHALTHRLSFFDTTHLLKYNEWLKAQDLIPHASRSNQESINKNKPSFRSYHTLTWRERDCVCERESETKRTRTQAKEISTGI